MADLTFSKGRKSVLIVLFVPSVERDGVTPVDQDSWVEAALNMMGSVFGGATAYPRARGVWRDDANAGRLIFDEPFVLHCYTTPDDLEDENKLAKLRDFCRQMGREANQGEVGLIIGDEYIAITDLAEE